MSDVEALARRPWWDRFGTIGSDTLAVSTFLFACGVYYFAESFVAYGWPALDGYPAIERWLDPSFLLADFYTNTTQGYGVDTWQAALFGTIQTHAGLGYASQIALLTALRHLLWPLVLYRFFVTLLKDRTTALLAVLLGVVSNFALPKTLGWSWVWGDGSPALFATFLVVLSWTELLLRRSWACLLLLSLATICQPLVGVHGGIFIAIVFLFDYSPTERVEAFRNPASYAAGLVFAATFLSQYLTLSPPTGSRSPVRDYVHILAWERHPGDFLPSRFPTETWVAFAIACVAMTVMLFREWQGLSRRALLVAGLAAYAAICLAGYLFVELWPVRLVIDLIPFRTVTIGAPLMLALISSFVASELRAGRWLSFLGIGAAFALAGDYGSKLGVKPVEAAVVLLGATILGAVAASRSGPIAARTVFDPMSAIVRLAIPTLVIASAPLAIVRKPMMILPTISNQHPLYEWASRATAPNARFLVEQVSSDPAYAKAISPQLMRLVGRRAVLASRDFPFRDSDGRRWLETWVVGLDHGKADRVETATVLELKAICRRLPYDYVVRSKPLPAEGAVEAARFASAGGVGPLHVYRVCGQPA